MFMLLENERIQMKWSKRNKGTYTRKGYDYFAGEYFYPYVKDVVLCSTGAKIPVKCDYCGQIYYPTVKNYLKVKQRNEKDCCVSCKGRKIKATVQEKYGVENIALVPEILEKTKSTRRKKYNVDFPLQNHLIFQKTQESLMNNHGVTNAAYIVESQEKKKHTCKEKYGCDYVVQNKEIQKKIHQSYFNNGSAPVSKKQKELAILLNKMFGNCELNYPCGMLSLDCMVNIKEKLYDIEYDGWYWHKDRKIEDIKRAFYVESQGYIVIRFLAYANRIPTEEEILQTLEYLTTTNKTYTLVELK